MASGKVEHWEWRVLSIVILKQFHKDDSIDMVVVVIAVVVAVIVEVLIVAGL